MGSKDSSMYTNLVTEAVCLTRLCYLLKNSVLLTPWYFISISVVALQMHKVKSGSFCQSVSNVPLIKFLKGKLKRKFVA